MKSEVGKKVTEEAKSDEVNTLSGSCFCGAVRWKAAPEILWAAFCHCEDCRKAASSDYVSWLGVERHSVEWTGPRCLYRSSDKVKRSFCSECGSPLSFETSVFPTETHMYAVTLDKPEVYMPTAHLFWSERLPWVSLEDQLPKHEKGLQSAAESGTTLF